MVKTVVSKSVQRRLAIQKAAKKVTKKPVKTVTKPVKKVKVKPEPIESEQEVEFDGHDVEDDFNNSACLDELDELDHAQEDI